MSVAFTSLFALKQVVAELGQRQSEVYLAIADWSGAHNSGPSIEDLARATGRKECSVCARVNELLKSGAIEVAGHKTNGTGAEAKTYRAFVYREFNPPPAAAQQQDIFSGTHAHGVEPYRR